MSQPIIEVERLTKKYQLGAIGSTTLREEFARWKNRLSGRSSAESRGVFWALRDVSFSVQPGEVVGVIGRNGAGKSTLLKLLSRVTEPTSGRAVLRGRVASLLEVGTGFHPDLTGRENVFLNGAILGMKRHEIASRFDEIVAFAEVGKFIDTPVKHYSSGMHVRLAFAVAAHLDPEILIVDEVLAVGDAAFQKKCLTKLGDVARSGKSIFFVSHNLDAVRSLCTHGIMLEHGELQFAGSALETVDRYCHRHTAEAGARWVRTSPAQPKTVWFETGTCRLTGRQPHLKLTVDVAIMAEPEANATFVAFDVVDRSLNPIMQILPETRPFIEPVAGRHQISVEVDLPPLNPGIYSVDLWAGRNFSATFDHVRSALAFEVSESPTPGRSFPHTPGHGYLVPTSRLQYKVPSSANPASTP